MAVRRKLGPILLTAAVLAGCGGAKSRPQPAGPLWRYGDIHFGVLAPLTGPERPRGTDLVDGATLAAEDLNVRGGVLGKRVRLDTLDDGCTASASRASAQALSGRTLGGVLGGICASAASAAAATLGGDLPFLVTSANSPRIVSARRTPLAYLTDGTPYQAALATSHFLIYRSAQRLAVVSDRDAASAALAKEVLGLAAPAPKAVSEQTVPAATADFAQVAKIALAATPDTVYFAGPAAASGTFVAALRAAGFKGTYIADAQSERPDFLAAAGAAGDGAFVITPASPQNLPAAAAWVKRFTGRFHRAPGRDAMLAYDALRTLAQAVTQSGKVDPKANAAELPRLDDSYAGFLGESLKFAADHTIKYDSNIALVVKGGAFRLDNTLRSAEG